MTEANAAINDRHVDVALLDITLPDGNSIDFARKLLDEGIPFAFSTGAYFDLPDGMEKVHVLLKPYDTDLLERTLENLCARATSARSSDSSNSGNGAPT